MRVVTKKAITDSDNDLILLVFKDDAERKMVIRHLQDMQDKPGERGYAIYDNEQFPPEEVRAFAKAFVKQP